MGAWGLGLFESDHDFDILSDFDREAGIAALEDEAKKRAKQQQSNTSKASEDPTANTGKTTGADNTTAPASSTTVSLHFLYTAAYVSRASLVREHLNSGVLLKLINEKKAKSDELSEQPKPGPSSDGKKAKSDAALAKYEQDWAVYELVFLGACASMSLSTQSMSLGCKIPDDFKALLIKKYRSTDLQRDALFQMQVALGDGPERYKEGEPYDFGSKRVEEMADVADKSSDLLFPGGQSFQMINVAAPFGMLRNPNQAPPKEFPADVCGGCGAKERWDGDPLLSCGGCKTRKYCGKVCQQAHFKRHKPLCKAKQER